MRQAIRPAISNGPRDPSLHKKASPICEAFFPSAFLWSSPERGQPARRCRQRRRAYKAYGAGKAETIGLGSNYQPLAEREQHLNAAQHVRCLQRRKLDCLLPRFRSFLSLHPGLYMLSLSATKSFQRPPTANGLLPTGTQFPETSPISKATKSSPAILPVTDA